MSRMKMSQSFKDGECVASRISSEILWEKGLKSFKHGECVASELNMTIFVPSKKKHQQKKNGGPMFLMKVLYSNSEEMCYKHYYVP